MDAPDEPNAVRRRETIGLDEGLTERQAVADFDQFADRSGYGGLKLESFEYEGAVHATNDLLAYAAPEAEQARDRLALAAMDKPAVMSWDVIADEIVRNRLDGVVPGDPRHQQAARAELVTAMSGPGWDGVQHRREAGPLVAADTRQALDATLARIRQHYETTPGAPHPARYPNRQAAAAAQLLGGEQARTVQDPTRWPAPDPNTRMTAGADGPAPQPAVWSEQRSPQIADPALRAAFSGQAPAAQAVQTAPSLGNGARGSSSGARAHDRAYRQAATNGSVSATHCAGKVAGGLGLVAAGGHAAPAAAAVAAGVEEQPGARRALPHPVQRAVAQQLNRGVGDRPQDLTVTGLPGPDHRVRR
jgi:hypothetical protein